MATPIAGGDAEILIQDEVDHETKIVFTTFVIEKIEHDDPTHATSIITATSTEMNRAENRDIADVGRHLARIADDINERYRQQFEQIADRLDMSTDNALGNFSQIVNSMLRGEANISRILTLFCFGYYLACRFLGNSSFVEFFNRIQNCVIQFVRDNMAPWIISQGGWLQLAASNEGISFSRVSLFAGIGITLILVIYYIRKRN